MPIGTLTVLDDFNYTENPLGSVTGRWARWAPLDLTATMQADGASAVNNGDGNLASAYTYTGGTGPDCGVFVTWQAIVGASSEGPAVGLGVTAPSGSTWTGYLLRVFVNSDNSMTNYFLYRSDAGVLTQIAAQSFAVSQSPGIEYGMTRIASVFTFYRNGSVIGTPVGDSTYTGGGVMGFWAFLTATVGSGTLDNFGGGTLGANTPLTGQTLLTGTAAVRSYGTVLIPLTP